MVMHEHSLRLLDFFRIREDLAGYCVSYEGQALMRATLPCARSESVQRLKRDIAVLIDGLNEVEIPSLPFPNIDDLLPKARKEGMLLELDELFALGLWIKSYEVLMGYLGSMLKLAPARIDLRRDRRLGNHRKLLSEGVDVQPEAETGFDGDLDEEAWANLDFEALIRAAPSLSLMQKNIFAILTPDGELRDLPRTRALKKAIQKVQSENSRLVNQYLTDPLLQDVLQSNAATERDNRTVIAVKANFKGRIKGIVHEFSSTGQTVFMEPMELVEGNNRLLELETKLNEEIRAVLREVADEIRPGFPAFDRARHTLALADVRLARALQAKRAGLALPRTLDSGIHLFQVRHPLLGGKAVPIDVDIPDGTKVLLITGPNTGGKTVSLKTIGLLAMLHQYGAGIPALETSGLAVFDTIYADIGDEQSIDQSLSTFSSHMTVIADIATHATDRSLVLLDELGAGTDPEEGCAIAMGLLDHFIERGSMTIVTTHHGVLKNYGYTKPSCLNASMEFNAKSLSPTYRIFMGVPGESRALDIALQTGLPRAIVDTAHGYLNDERSDYTALIRSLGEKQRELDSLEREKKKQLQGALESRRIADLEKLKVRQRELELRRQGVSDLAHFLSDSRKTFENLVRTLRESGRMVEEAPQGRKFLQELADDLVKKRDELTNFERETKDLEARISSAEAQISRAKADELVPGSRVVYQRKEATLLRMVNEGKALVQIGSLKLTVPLAELGVVHATKKQPAESQHLSYQVELSSSFEGSGRAASGELDVRGMRLTEALDILRKQIDAACLAGLGTFSVIHGTGEGILAKGIHEWLKTQSVIADYYFARPEDGGFGKTWIHLKS